MDLTSVGFIYFDIDDTLLDHSAAAAGALLWLHTEFSQEIGHIPAELFIERFHHENNILWKAMARREITADEVKIHRFSLTLAHLLDEHPDTMRHIGTIMSRSFLDRYGDYWQLHPAAEEAIIAAESIAPTGLLTNGFPEQQYGKLRRFGWENRFAAVVLSADAGAMKPDFAIFDYARRAACIDDPTSIVYIGDSYDSDIAGAKNAGWQTVWLNSANAKPPGNDADFIVKSLHEVVGLLK